MEMAARILTNRSARDEGLPAIAIMGWETMAAGRATVSGGSRPEAPRVMQSEPDLAPTSVNCYC
jgi:hypothetical protein